MTYQEYWQEVSALALSILQEAKNENPDMSEDDLLDEINDRLHETIDGHQWIIYNSYNLDVIKHSNNQNYMAENIGDFKETVIEKGFFGLCQAVAYWAMYADIEAFQQDIVHTMLKYKVGMPI